MALMQVPMPILMLHGLDDQLCRPNYLKWHLRFETAMENQDARQYGSRLASFASFTVPGDHDDIAVLFENLAFHELSNPKIDGFWRAMLSAGSASPQAVQAPPEPVQASAPSPVFPWASSASISSASRELRASIGSQYFFILTTLFSPWHRCNCFLPQCLKCFTFLVFFCKRCWSCYSCCCDPSQCF